MVKWAGKADYLFAWGDAFKRRFDELYDKPEIINTGNPRFDPYLNPEIADTLYPSRAQLASRYDLDPEKDWVLLALDFPLLFTSDARLKELIDQGDASHERIEVMRKVYDQLRTWTRRWDSEEGDSAILIVRPHPASNLEKIEGDFGEESSGLRYIEGGAISPWIIAVDRYVTRASTSTVEAWLADTPAGLIGRDMHLDAGIEREHIREAQVTVDTYSEFSEYINATELRSSQDAHHSFLSTHFRLDGHASQRTAHELKRIALRQRENPTLKGGRPENIFRHIQFIIKKTINETGINKLNPFERPNENFLSRHKGKQIVKNIGEKIG